MREFDKILDNEKVLWEGWPQFVPFVVSSLIIAPVALVLLAIGWVALSDGLSSLFSSFFLLVGLVLLLALPVYRVFSHKHMHYAITDKRVILQKGLIGRDFVSVGFEIMEDVQVTVNLFDRLFGKNSGSVLIYVPSTGKSKVPHRFWHIEDPYSVFKQLERFRDLALLKPR